MAVEMRYVVTRNGEEKMTFISKKEADAYDKMLDLADELALLLGSSPLALSDDQQEELALFLAQRRDTLSHLLNSVLFIRFTLVCSNTCLRCFFNKFIRLS